MRTNHRNGLISNSSSSPFGTSVCIRNNSFLSSMELMSPLSVWLFYCFGTNVSESGNIVFCFWKCAARGLEATLFLMLLRCSAPWVFKGLVVFYLLVHMGSGTYYNTFDFNFLSHVRMIETVDFMSKVTLLTVTKWVIARGYITEKMRGW